MKIENIYLCFETENGFKELEFDINEMNKLIKENKQLKDNWNKLKEIAKSQSDLKLKCHNDSLWFEIDDLLNKMQELEKGDSNE